MFMLRGRSELTGCSGGGGGRLLSYCSSLTLLLLPVHTCHNLHSPRKHRDLKIRLSNSCLKSSIEEVICYVFYKNISLNRDWGHFLTPSAILAGKHDPQSTGLCHGSNI